MSTSNGHFAHTIKKSVEQACNVEEFITIEQLQRLVHILDQSDVSELEVKHSVKKARLVLRKAKPLEEDSIHSAMPHLPTEASSSIEQTRYTITASLVGIFHPCSTSKEKPLGMVGDSIKKGQHIGAIQSLDIFNEVESPVNGCVVEILVEDGQSVEYGQPLIIVDEQ